MSSWESYQSRVERGPWSAFWTVVLGLFAMGAVVWVLGAVCGTVNEAGTVARNQFGPQAVVVKYEWFKDAAAQLQKKQADIALYEKRMKRCETPKYRDERERCGIWESEMLGIVASYNGLAAEYNANMSKVNWQFASASIPREVATYNNGAK